MQSSRNRLIQAGNRCCFRMLDVLSLDKDELFQVTDIGFFFFIGHYVTKLELLESSFMVTV